jgi:hypothetical protein
MFFQSLVGFCLALSGARLVAAGPRLNARQEPIFASVCVSHRVDQAFQVLMDAYRFPLARVSRGTHVSLPTSIVLCSMFLWTMPILLEEELMFLSSNTLQTLAYHIKALL